MNRRDHLRRTGAVGLFATALLPLVMLPLLGIATLDKAAVPFANPVVFLLFGGFLIALAVERWNLETITPIVASGRKH